MKTVLYTQNMKPLCIVDLPNGLRNLFAGQSHAVALDFGITDYLSTANAVNAEECYVCHIKVEYFMKGDVRHPMLFLDKFPEFMEDLLNDSVFDGLQAEAENEVKSDFFSRLSENIQIAIGA
jgi:hypothetical protein